MTSWRGLLERAALSGRSLALAAAVAPAGCSGPDVVPQPAVAPERASLTEVLGSLSGRCPGIEERDAQAPLPDDAVFVEAAIVEAPKALADQATLETLVDLSRSEQVNVLFAPHVIAKWDEAVQLGIGSSGAMHGPELMRWKVVPRRTAGGAVLELELDLAIPHRNSESGSPRELALSTSARLNEPTLVRVVWDEPTQRSLVLLIRAFAVHGQEELRSIFECKMQERSRWLRQRAAAPSRD